MPVYPPDNRFAQPMPQIEQVGDTTYVRPPANTIDNQWDQMRRAYEGLPLEQATQYINTALRFQALRKFQQDVASGVPEWKAAQSAALLMSPDLKNVGTTVNAYGRFMPPQREVMGNNEVIYNTQGLRVMPMPQEAKFIDGPEGTKFVQTGNSVKQVDLPSTVDAVKPQEMLLSNGQRIAYNPRTGSFKAISDDGSSKDFTYSQLMSLSDNMDSGNPAKEQIRSFLSNSASNQVYKASQPRVSPQSETPATTQASKSPYKDGDKVRNKRDGKLYVIRNGVPVLAEGQ